MPEIGAQTSYPCSHAGCGKVYASERLLKGHIRDKHTDAENLLRCTNCGYSADSERGMKMHVSLMHAVHKVTCPEKDCRRTFPDNDKLKYHKQQHKRKPFQCAGCNVMFEEAGKLTEHQPCAETYISRDEQAPIKNQWVCTYQQCRMPFPSKKLVADHIQISHLGRQQASVKSVAAKPRRQASANSTAAPAKQVKSARSTTKLASKKTSRRSEDEDSYPESEQDDENSIRPTTIKALIGAVSYASAQQCLSAVMEAHSRLYYSALPETPSLSQEALQGSNLRAFQNAQYINTTADFESVYGWNFSDPSGNLNAFLNTTAYRQLYPGFTRDKQTGIINAIRIANFQGRDNKYDGKDEEQFFTCKGLGLTSDSVKSVANYMRQILERTPSLVTQLSRKHQLWVITMAVRLAFHNNPDMKVEPPNPVYNSRANRGMQQRSVRFWVYGYDPRRNHAWSRQMYVPVGDLRLEDIIERPPERIVWTGTGGDIQHGTDDRHITDDDLKQAQALAKMLVVGTYGFIGNWIECNNMMVERIASFWKPDHQETRLPELLESFAGRQWNGQNFVKRVTTEEKNTLLIPEPIIADNMRGSPHPIIILDIDTAKTYSVVKVMLEALRKGHNADISMAMGSIEADFLNKDTGEEQIILSCTDESHTTEPHLCPNCLKLVPHQDLTQLPVLTYKVCLNCEHELKKVPWSFKAYEFGSTIYERMLDEDKAGQHNRTPEEMHRMEMEIYDHLKENFHIEGSYYKDGYVKQKLNHDGPKVRNWYGRMLNGLVPSIEAIDPVVRGPDNKTGYHVLNNIILTSDSLNRAKKHFPPICLHGIYLLRQGALAGNKELYESGIALFRIAISNHYAYGKLGGSQQCRRIGNELPPNFDEIAKSFREPILLPCPKSAEYVYRFIPNRQAVGKVSRKAWRHTHSIWLNDQIRAIGIEVFGDEQKAQKYQDLWMRKDSSGHEVFFPFNQYSVVEDWTEWDLYECLAVKGIRNVEHCQKPHADQSPPIPYTLEMLELIIANLWIRRIKYDLDRGIPRWACGLDDADLGPQPSMNELLCASLGHADHGMGEDPALEDFELGGPKTVRFVPERCGFKWETQFCNYLKFSYANEAMPEILKQLNHILCEPGIYGNPDPILPSKPYKLKLADYPNPFEGSQNISRPDIQASRLPRMSPAEVKRLQSLVDEWNARVGRAFRPKTSAAVSGSTSRDHTSPMKIVDTQAARNMQDTHMGNTNETLDVDDGIDIDFDEGLDDADMQLAIAASFDFTLDTNRYLRADKYRNMANLGSTCYLSAVVTMLAHTTEFAELLSTDHDLQLLSGRPPTVLQEDPKGEGHVKCYQSVNKIFRRLAEGGDRLPKDHTADLVYSLPAKFANKINEPAFFYRSFIEFLIVMTDNSKPLNKPDVEATNSRGEKYLRHAYSPEEELDRRYEDSVRQDHQFGTLFDHTEQHWAQHAASGHSSLVSDLTTIQYSDLFECSSSGCTDLQRLIHYSNTLQLEVSRMDDTNGSINLLDLITKNLEERFSSRYDKGTGRSTRDQARPCGNEVYHTAQSSTGELVRSIRHITKTPVYLMIEINRRIQIRQPHGEVDRVALQLEAELNPHMNRITNYSHLDLANVISRTPKPTNGDYFDNEFSHEEMQSRNLTKRYVIKAIVAYSSELTHYTLFMNIENEWVYFNDLDSYPVLRNPFTDWPFGFVGSMLYYKVDETQHAGAPTLVSEQAQDQIGSIDAVLAHSQMQVQSSASAPGPSEGRVIPQIIRSGPSVVSIPVPVRSELRPPLQISDSQRRRNISKGAKGQSDTDVLDNQQLEIWKSQITAMFASASDDDVDALFGHVSDLMRSRYRDLRARIQQQQHPSTSVRNDTPMTGMEVPPRPQVFQPLLSPIAQSSKGSAQADITPKTRMHREETLKTLQGNDTPSDQTKSSSDEFGSGPDSPSKKPSAAWKYSPTKLLAKGSDRIANLFDNPSTRPLFMPPPPMPQNVYTGHDPFQVVPARRTSPQDMTMTAQSADNLLAPSPQKERSRLRTSASNMSKAIVGQLRNTFSVRSGDARGSEDLRGLYQRHATEEPKTPPKKPSSQDEQGVADASAEAAALPTNPADDGDTASLASTLDKRKRASGTNGRQSKEIKRKKKNDGRHDRPDEEDKGDGKPKGRSNNIMSYLMKKR